MCCCYKMTKTNCNATSGGAHKAAQANIRLVQNSRHHDFFQDLSVNSFVETGPWLIEK